jgi:hypothetical protein
MEGAEGAGSWTFLPPDDKSFVAPYRHRLSLIVCHAPKRWERGRFGKKLAVRTLGAYPFRMMRFSMTFSEFTALVDAHPGGVVLLEGRRTLPATAAAQATNLAARLANSFTRLRFRSGNAAGSDQAFSEGIARVDASRLQVIAPYASHRKSIRYADASYDFPSSLSAVQEDEIAYKTATASPQNKGLIAKRAKSGAIAAKAAYLIRDTMKVTGHSEEFPKPICAIFYADLQDPMAGGTGHTIRVCKQEGVPVAFQDSWQLWLGEGCELAPP